jgi:cytochrome c2
MLNPADPIPVAARCRVCHRLSYDPREVGRACWRIADRDGNQCGGLMKAVA